METSAKITLGILVLVFLVGALFVGNYNGLVSSENQVKKAWSQVDTQYQRRLDLIDNLVSSVKGAQGQEQKVFGAIADARKQYNAASSPNDQAAAAGKIETNVALLPRLQEAYPDLKSNTQVTQLMNDLRGTEDGILKARDHYNAVATNYNTSIERFPTNFFAGLYGKHEATLFKSDAGASKAPKVNF